MKFPAYSAALLMLLAVPALAQTQAEPPAVPVPAAPAPGTAMMAAPPKAAPPAAAQFTVAGFVAQPAYQAAIIAIGKGQLEHVPGGCPGAQFQPTGQAAVLSPVRFNNEGKPITGAWMEKIATTGCGPVRAVNVLSVAHPNGETMNIAMMPGDTHTDPLMQKNALQYAQAVAVRAAARGCKEQAFIDTTFDGYTGLPNPEIRDGRDGRAWEETWTVSACGTLYDIHLLFTPNANGTELRGSNPVKRS